jgi:formate-dependent phosphoribosylglycinamide formyltransferase (GAR transformylase)
MKTIMVLAAGPLQIPAIVTARRLGLHVVAVDADAQAPGLALADVARVANITDYDACLAIARAEHAHGVIQICTEVSIPVIGRLNAAMGWAGLRPEVALDATNKHRMRRAFERGGALRRDPLAVAPSPRRWRRRGPCRAR